MKNLVDKIVSEGCNSEKRLVQVVTKQNYETGLTGLQVLKLSKFVWPLFFKMVLLCTYWNILTQNCPTQISSSQSEEQTMFLRHRKNSSSNRYRERGFFFLVREKKCSSNQKPQRVVSFAPSFPPLRAFATPSLRGKWEIVIHPFANNGVATFFAEKLLGVVHKISKEEQADHYHVVVIVIRYLMYL